MREARLVDHHVRLVARVPHGPEQVGLRARRRLGQLPEGSGELQGGPALAQGVDHRGMAEEVTDVAGQLEELDPGFFHQWSEVTGTRQPDLVAAGEQPGTQRDERLHVPARASGHQGDPHALKQSFPRSQVNP